MQFEEVLSHFSVVKKYGNKAQCKCPAHDDGKASLTISEGRKGIVLHCHAGCDPEAVCQAAGLQQKDLFYDDTASAPVQVDRWKQYVEKRSGKRIESIYHFTDLQGKYVYTKLRMTGKDMIYGILENDRFTYGLQGKSRKDLKGLYKNAQSVRDAISAGERVFYCEGEKDVNAMISHGFTAITAGGVNDWQKDFSEVFRGGDVIVLSDNDDPGVRSSRQIVRDLQGVAKSVRMIIPTPELKKGDISDFFIDHGDADFEILLQTGTAAKSENMNSRNQEIMNSSERLDLDQFHIVTEQGRITGVFDWAIFTYIKEQQDLFVMGGTPYIYDHGVYLMDETGAKLKTMIRELIYPKFIKSGTLKRIYDLFLSDVDLQVSFDDINNYPSHWINFQNGFYDPKSRRMIPHSPEYRSINQLPHEYDPAARPEGKTVEEWLQFIAPDQEDREMILQFSGYCLTMDVSQQKFMILNGEGGSGKSTLIRMIEEMIGSENISNISLTELQTRFASFGLMGKLLNSCADLEISALEDTSTLKKSLGEDRLRGEQKGHDAVSFKSYAKMIFSTNELPLIKSERTNGFYRRLLIMTMNKVPEKKRSDFFTELSSEIDYFIHISIDALQRMYDSGHILESKSSTAAINQMKFDSDTVEAWLQEETIRDKGSRVERSSCYQKYDQYCQDNDRQSLSRTNFYKAMRSKGYEEKRTAAGRFICDISFEKSVTKTVTDQEGFVTVDDQQELPFS